MHFCRKKRGDGTGYKSKGQGFGSYQLPGGCCGFPVDYCQAAICLTRFYRSQLLGIAFAQA